MESPPQSSTPSQGRKRDHTERVSALKQVLASGSVLAFLGFMLLAADNVVGVTAASGSTSDQTVTPTNSGSSSSGSSSTDATQTVPNSGGYFSNGGSVGQAPILSSRGS
ncbi:MAG TPA: hypothetical protein VG015_08370 [Candidatus Dormibacteraeota bacterium]|nr:hypothetical protein [Candidatus Dormibacteraeota bacterium]